MASNGTTLLYNEALGRERPKTTLATLQTRARRSRLLGESLADYLSERIEAEETYIKSLQKIQRKGLIPPSYDLELGKVTETLKRRFEIELEDLIKFHENLSKRLESEVIGTIREGSRVGENSLKQNDTTAASVAKEFEEANTRVTKLQSKSSTRKPDSSQKISQAETDLSRLAKSWRSAVLPSLFAAYESVDKARLEGVKEGLAKYQTLSSDLARERLDLAEKGLNDVINWDLDEDSAEWLRSQGGGRGGDVSLSSGRSNSANEMGQIERPAPAASNQHLSPSLAQSRSTDRTPSIHSATRSGGGFFSKLTPKLNRNRSSSHPSAYGNLDTPNNFTSPSRSLTAPYSPPDEEASESLRDLPEPIRPGAPTTTPNKPRNRDSIVPNILRRKGSTSERSPASQNRPNYDRAASSGMGNSTNLRNGSSTIEENRVSPNLSNGTPSRMTATNVDAEGFTIPPANYDQSPWQNSAPAPGASLMDEDDDLSVTLPKPTNLEIQQAPLQVENEADREAALLRVKSTLLSKAPASGLNRRTTRGRRDVRVTTFNPIPDDMPLAKVLEMQGQSVPEATTSETAPSTSLDSTSLPMTSATPPPSAGRAMSLLSVSSSRDQLSASLTSPFEHPDGPGLRASLTETVHILYKAGQVDRVMVTGEVSLLIKDLSPNVESNFRIRVANYEVLEKSAPNTHFISAVPDMPGEYIINGGLLVNSSNTNQATTILRYHLLINDNANSDYVPLRLDPQWKCEPNVTSILINYSSLPSSRFVAAAASPFDEPSPAILQDVTMLAPITSGHVSSTQSKPAGTYSAERKRLQWRLDDIDLGQKIPLKVLARLAVDETSQVQPVAMRWRLPGRLVSAIDLEVVSEGLQFEELVKSTQGRFLAAP